MTGARATSALRGTRFGSLRWLDETGSTNADALAAARDGVAEGLVVVADHQTAGRGRRDRTWVAPPGSGLLVSMLVRPPASATALLPMLLGIALVDAVDEVAGFLPSLKWPNDLVAQTGDGERKLAGMLAAVDWPADTAARPAVVLGFGLNVNWHGRVPDGLADTAVALDGLTGLTVDREDLLVAVIRHFDERYQKLLDGLDTPEAIVGAWREELVTLGRRVVVVTEQARVEGVADDVTVEGHLIVVDDAGGRRTCASGDVVHLRNAG